MKYLLTLLFVLAAALMVQAQEVNKVDVSVEEKDGLKKITIKKHLKDGSIDVINWEGTGEIPKEIKKEMEGGKNFFIEIDDKKVEIIGDPDGELHEKHFEIKVGDGDDDIKIIKNGKVIKDGDENVFILKGDDMNNNFEWKSKDGKSIKVIKNGKVIRTDGDGDEVEIIIHEEGKNKKKIKRIKRGGNNEDNVFILREGDRSDEEEREVEVIVKEIKDGNAKVDVFVFEDEDGKTITKKIGHKVIIVEKDGKEATVEVKVIGEEDKDQEEVNKVVELERALKLKDFSLAPNPASEQIQVRFKGQKAPMNLLIFDAQGRELYKEFIKDFDGRYNNQIDLQGINADLLFISIEQGGKKYTDKIAVKK